MAHQHRKRPTSCDDGDKGLHLLHGRSGHYRSRSQGTLCSRRAQGRDRCSTTRRAFASESTLYFAGMPRQCRDPAVAQVSFLKATVVQAQVHGFRILDSPFGVRFPIRSALWTTCTPRVRRSKIRKRQLQKLLIDGPFHLHSINVAGRGGFETSLRALYRFLLSNYSTLCNVCRLLSIV